MNILNWCKSFLSIYPIISDITSSIDNLILIKGVNSSAICSGNVSTYSQMESIINLTQKKINLINLKIITDETLLEMNKDKAKILMLKFIDNVPNDKIMDLFSLSRRTYFRRVNSALSEFESVFNSKLLRKEKVYKSFLDEKFLDEIFEKINVFQKKMFESSYEDDFSKYSKSITSFVINRMKKVI